MDDQLGKRDVERVICERQRFGVSLKHGYAWQT